MFILLCGYNGSGKKTCADYFHSKYSFNRFTILKYLKDMLFTVFNFGSGHFETGVIDLVDPVWKISPSDAMEYVGTGITKYEKRKYFANIRQDLWFSMMNKDITENVPVSQHIVISDLRFVHEYAYIRRAFPNEAIHVVKVLRSSIPLQNMVTTKSEGEHTKLSYNYIIPNNGNIEDLHKSIDKLIERVSLNTKCDFMYVLD
jgi:hypothetical protein